MPTERDLMPRMRVSTNIDGIGMGQRIQRNVSFEHVGLVLSLNLGAGSASDGRDRDDNATMEVAIIRSSDSHFYTIANDAGYIGYVPVSRLPFLLATLFASVYTTPEAEGGDIDGRAAQLCAMLNHINHTA